MTSLLPRHRPSAAVKLAYQDQVVEFCTTSQLDLRVSKLLGWIEGLPHVYGRCDMYMGAVTLIGLGAVFLFGTIIHIFLIARYGGVIFYKI
jgi:hypothetical protein